MITYKIVRNGSLWSEVVFEKEVIFHEFDFETSDLEFEVSKSSLWKHTSLCDKGVLFFHSYLATWQPIELKLSQVCYFMHMLRSSAKTGLRQLPIVSNVFKLVSQQNEIKTTATIDQNVHIQIPHP